MRTDPGRYERWRRKLRYLVMHHGGLAAIARAAHLKPRSMDRILNAASDAKPAPALALEPEAAKQIETALDLPEGWFDASTFLPSRL